MAGVVHPDLLQPGAPPHVGPDRTKLPEVFRAILAAKYEGVALAGLGQSFSQTPPNIAMMAVLLSTLPIIVFFIFCQRYFINGLGGAIKE